MADLGLDVDHQLVEQLEGLRLVFDERIALAVGAQADALGRLHCIQNGTGSVTSLLVFSPAGTEVRRVAANQGGVDMALRP